MATAKVGYVVLWNSRVWLTFRFHGLGLNVKREFKELGKLGGTMQTLFFVLMFEVVVPGFVFVVAVTTV